MKTRTYALPALCLLLAGCDLGGNVYPLSQQDAYNKLVSARIEQSGKGVFGTLDTSVSGDGSSTIYWSGTGSHGGVSCEANLTPDGADKTSIMAHCSGGGASDGAAAGMVQNLMRSRLIEHIDATLRGRAFDPQAAMGSTAGSWPKDPRQADASIGAAAGEALAMERDMHKMIADQKKFDEAASAAREEARKNADVSFEPGQPMVDTTN